MARTVDVVVVGGGIVGCATAYFLAKEGINVTIVERGALGDCASGYSAGLLNPLDGHGIPGPLEPLAQESFRMHLHLAEEIKAETGVDPQSRILSCIWVAFNDTEAEEFMPLYQIAQRLEGFPARWLDGPALKALEPRISPQVISAMSVEGMGQVDSYHYTLALAQAAERHGAVIRHDTVRKLRQSSGGVSEVLLAGEELTCKKVVLAMGPWSGQVENWLGVRVPISPLKGQILRLALQGPPLRYAFYRSGGGYVSSKPDGLIWAGTTEERVGFDDRPTPEGRESILKGAMEILPCLSEARLALQTACLRPVSEDGLPIIGEVPGWNGVFMATGAGRKGILLAPAMAKATAELVTAGHTNLPVEPFSLGRFAGSSI